ncbi:unnamed protein product [Ambrosiozyma monospora]|uniref:Unnamed protein product n=1 Tax=Ambrosiozyma monospora TaxID=43982 RepID=A0ACB5TDX1_AMBMO|nr:unnamed protein product [Ambrosiozyma monospora]
MSRVQFHPMGSRISEIRQVKSPNIIEILIFQLTTKDIQVTQPSARFFISFKIQNRNLVSITTIRSRSIRGSDSPFQ